MRIHNLICILFIVCFGLPTFPQRAQATTADDWLIQLGLYSSNAQAANAWQVLNAVYPTVFGGLAPEYRAINTGSQSMMLLPGRQEINTGGQTMHLLGAGRFGTQQEAEFHCEDLKAKGGNCFVVQFRPYGTGEAAPPAASLTDLSPPPPAPPQPPQPPQELQAAPQAAAPEQPVGGRVIIWGGVDVAGRSYYAYAGSVQSLSGRNIHTQDGFLIRESVGYGDYRFKKTGVVGDVTGTVRVGDLMLGYKNAFNNGGIAVYAGGSIENHDRSANDAGNSVIGTHAGFASSADAQIRATDRVTLLGMASYASANRSYWTHFSAGYAFDMGPLGRVSVGPTAGFSGGKDYDIQRYGVTASDINVGFANMYVYTGYATYSNDTDNVYGGLGFGKSF